MKSEPTKKIDEQNEPWSKDVNIRMNDIKMKFIHTSLMKTSNGKSLKIQSINWKERWWIINYLFV